MTVTRIAPLINRFFIQRDVESIFRYRESVLRSLYPSREAALATVPT